MLFGALDSVQESTEALISNRLMVLISLVRSWKWQTTIAEGDFGPKLEVQSCAISVL